MDAKKLFLLVSLFFLSVFLVNSVYAIGISPPSADVTYRPSGVYADVPFNARNNAPREVIVTVNITGDLARYASASRNEFLLSPGESGRFIVTLDFPPGLQNEFVGQNNLNVVVTESAPDTDGLFAVKTSVTSRVRVHFPYPGEYLEITRFSVTPVNHGLDAPFEWEVTSRGDMATNFNARIDVLGPGESILFSESFASTLIGPGDVSSNKGVLPTSELGPGRYPVMLAINYAGEEKTRSSTLRIGEEDVELVSYSPKELFFNSINEFSFRVESLWGENFGDVSAEIAFGGRTTRTPSERLPRFGTSTFKHFLDTTGLEPGEYDASITVFFGGNSKEFPVSLIVLTEEETRERKGEEGEGFSFDMFHIVIGLSVLVLLLLVVNMLFLFRKKK